MGVGGGDGCVRDRRVELRLLCGKGLDYGGGLARQAGRLDEQPESQGAADEEGEERAAEHGGGGESAGWVQALSAEVSAVVGTVRLTATRAAFGGLIIAGVAAHYLYTTYERAAGLPRPNPNSCPI